MQIVMNITDTYGVLGSDIFKNFGVCFNCNNNELILIQRQNKDSKF